MYSVFALVEGNEICIYDDWSDAEEIRLIDPQLELERNSAGSFTFTLPPTNIAYGTYVLKTYTIDGFDANKNPIMVEHNREVDLIQRIATKIIIYRDMETSTIASRDRQKFWEGRVVSEEKDWYNCRMVTCEGDLAYFNDTCQKPVLFGFAASVTDDPITIMTHVINYHNSKVDQSKSFTLASDCQISDPRTGDSKQYEITYRSTMETIQDLIKTFGGVIQVYYEKQVVDDLVTWKRMIRWDDKDKIVRTSDLQPQTINFGRNLLDFKCNWDLSKLCTVAVPTGAQQENDGKDEIGDSLTKAGGDSGQYLFLDTDGIVYIPNTEGQTIEKYKLKDYKTAVWNVGDYITECDNNHQERTIYLTCRLTSGLVAICYCSKPGFYADEEWGDTQLGYIVASPQQGYTYQDFIDYKITLPYNCKSIAVCSYGDDIKMDVKRRKFTTENTVTETEISVDTWDDHGIIRTRQYSKKLVFEMVDDTTKPIPDTDPVEYEQKRSGDIIYEDDDNYITRVYNFPQELLTELSEKGSAKIYISGRSENGTAIYVVSNVVNGLDGSTDHTTYYHYEEASNRNSKLDEVDEIEFELHAGCKSITIAGYKGGNNMPRVTYNRSETRVKNQDAPKEKYVTVESATVCPEWHETGSEYVINKDLVEKYGYIERILSFETIDNPNLLCQAAVQYLQNIAFDEMTIDISAIDMRALGVQNTDYFNINDALRCVSEYHGLDKFLPITKLSIPLNKPDGMKVMIGETTQETMSENTNRVNSDLMDSIVTNRQTTLSMAKDEAKSLLIEGESGYVTLERTADGEHIKQLVVSDTQDPSNSNNVWVFNKNGLGHVDHYPIDPDDSNINLALTSNGAIVADRITTGTLRSLLISGTSAIFGCETYESPDHQTRTYEGSICMGSDDNWATHGQDKRYKAMIIKQCYLSFCNHQGVDITADGEQSKYSLKNPVEYARIYGNTEREIEEGLANNQLLSIAATTLALNVDDLWICTTSNYAGGGTGGTDAVPGINQTTPCHLIRDDQDLAGYSCAVKVYLPKSKTADPNEPNDWLECYVNNGILTEGTTLPVTDVKIRHGIVIDSAY